MNIRELKGVVEKSYAIFNKLKKKYPDLDGYLVFSSPYGQCELTTNAYEILNSFPQMIADDSRRYKEKSLMLLKDIAKIELKIKKNTERQKPIDNLMLQLNEFTSNLEICDDIFVEIRFNHKADYHLIHKLQKDETIFHKHTTQTKASIRIVLGTVLGLKQ